MGIKVTWEDANENAIRFDCEGNWDWHDFYTSIDQCNALLDTVSHPVDLIIDFRRSNRIPEGMIGHMDSLRKRRHPNMGMTVLIGANPFVKALHNLFRRLFEGIDSRFALASSPEEAQVILAERRAKTTLG